MQSALAFPVILSSWMYADVPATNVLAPDRIRVLAALCDRTMISRLLLAKTAVLWVFVAPLCAVLALVVGWSTTPRCSSAPRSSRSASSPSRACQSRRWSGIRWPYHPLQLHYRWDHRVPLRRMIVRWLILAVVPYALVPALCLLMIVPALILLVLTHSANKHVISFIDAEGKPFGLALSGPSHPLSGGMFAAGVALTCGVAVVVWVLGRRADMWLIRRRQRRSPHTWRPRRGADRGTGGRTPVRRGPPIGGTELWFHRESLVGAVALRVRGRGSNRDLLYDRVFAEWGGEQVRGERGGAFQVGVVVSPGADRGGQVHAYQARGADVAPRAADQARDLAAQRPLVGVDLIQR